MSELKKTNDRKKETLLPVYAGLFAALIYVASAFINIRMPNGGCINLGDGFVLLAGLFLGPIYGTAAAAVGSLLCDLLAGYTMYAPATAVIKGAMVLILLLSIKLLKTAGVKYRAVAIGISAVICEIFMILGYLFYELVVLRLGAGALTGALGNIAQGIGGVVTVLAFSTTLIPAVSKSGLFSPYVEQRKYKG